MTTTKTMFTVETTTTTQTAKSSKRKGQSTEQKTDTPVEQKSGTPAKKKCRPTPVGAGVIILSRIPHGFYEDQMRAYFSQFGEITRLRLARNSRTGASKHYAFVEFKHEEVARIVADTMHNYLMFGRLLQCELVANEKVHPDTFIGANRKFTPIPWKKISREAHNADKTPEQTEAIAERRSKHIKSVEERCKALGISWDAADL